MIVSPLKSLALAVACAACGALQAQERQAPQYQVEDCCSLCPAAHDASRYTSNYMKNFITLMDAEGRTIILPRDDIEESRRGVSAMPADLIQHLSRRDVRDLVEFLAGLRSGGRAAGHGHGR